MARTKQTARKCLIQQVPRSVLTNPRIGKGAASRKRNNKNNLSDEEE